MKQTLEQIDLIRLMIDANRKYFGLALNVDDVGDVFRSKRLACLIGVEGLHQIGHSFSVLRTYQSLGVRYITLTHTKTNDYADACVSRFRAI